MLSAREANKMVVTEAEADRLEMERDPKRIEAIAAATGAIESTRMKSLELRNAFLVGVVESRDEEIRQAYSRMGSLTEYSYSLELRLVELRLALKPPPRPWYRRLFSR